MRRVYRTKIFVKGFSLVFFTIALFFIISTVRGLSSRVNTWLDVGIATVLVLAGAILAAQSFTGRVVLEEDSIRHGNIFRNQSMHLSRVHYRREFKEYQEGPEGGVNVYYLELVPYDRSAESLKISKNDFNFDSDFWEWMARIPDVEDLKP